MRSFARHFLRLPGAIPIGYNIEVSDLEARIREEFGQIIRRVSELTRLPSRWSGRLVLVPDAEFKGLKRFSCDVWIDMALAHQDSRWPTLIHEALHAASAGFVPEDYQAYRGWEEGVVEQLQRLLRGQILKDLHIQLAESLLADADAHHYFNPYIGALEALRRALHVSDAPADVLAFYVDLPGIPLRARSGYILGRGYQQQGAERSRFIALYSQSNGTLTMRRLR